MENKRWIIEQRIKCLYCGEYAYQRGPQRMGFGINNISYKCSNKNCKAVTMSLRHSNKEIETMEIDIKYKED